MGEITGLVRGVLTWFSGHELVGYLTFVMVCDLLTGLTAAAKLKQINSSIAANGWIRKSAILLAVTFAWVMEPLVAERTGVAGIGEIVTLGFIATESVSIVENLNRSGVAMPVWFTTLFTKLTPAADETPKRRARG